MLLTVIVMCVQRIITSSQYRLLKLGGEKQRRKDEGGRMKIKDCFSFTSSLSLLPSSLLLYPPKTLGSTALLVLLLVLCRER